MMPALVLPRSDDLHCAPERAALALLDAALSAATATAAVLAENPDLPPIADPAPGRALPAAALAAATPTAAVPPDTPAVATPGHPGLVPDPPLTTQLAARLAA